MRQLLGLVGIAVTVLLGLVAPVAAQDATPAPGGAAAPGPAVGEPFPYTDPETGAQAAITIAAINDPATDIAAGAEPEPGTRYVMLSVIYENTGPGPVETRPDAFVVQDSDGYLWSPTSVTRADDITVPNLQRVEMAPSDRITGMVAFQLPAAAELARVLYQPASARLLVLAELAAQAQPGPTIGTAVGYEDVETTAQGRLTVTELQDPFTEVPEGYEAEPGSRYVLVLVTVENTGSVPLEVSPSNLLLRDQAGLLWGYTSVHRGGDVVVPDLQSQTLAPGSRISGAVGFQLPAEAAVADVLYQPVSGRLLFLARLPAAAGSPVSGAAVAAITPGCEGVDAWYALTREHIARATALSQQAAQLDDRASLETAAQGFADLADAQAAMDVPAAAEALNAELVAIFTAYQEALTQIATAGNAGGDAQADVIEGMNAFNAASRDFAPLPLAVVDLATSCGVST